MQMTSMNPKFMHMILSTGVTPDVIAHDFEHWGYP